MSSLVQVVLAKATKGAMAPAAGAELGALPMGAQGAVALRDCLGAMGYPQPPTPMGTGANTADGATNNTMGQGGPKAIDMGPHWLRGRANRGQPYTYWGSGKTNFADYYTKHHPTVYHRANRATHTYVEGGSPSSLQGCVNIMTEDRQP